MYIEIGGMWPPIMKYHQTLEEARNRFSHPGRV